MAEAAGFIAVMQFQYRGADEEWSQGYHIADAWVDEADFRATMDVVRVELEDCVSADCYFNRFIGYQDRSAPHDYVYDVSSHSYAGALDVSAMTPMPGDCAAWIRWQMARRSSRGKPVYLRKYFHDVYADEDGDKDALAANQATAFATFAAHARDGSWNGHLIADKFGVPTIAAGLDRSNYITTRTLERRGRRRPPP
jgi:hypothetical protein